MWSNARICSLALLIYRDICTARQGEFQHCSLDCALQGVNGLPESIFINPVSPDKHNTEFELSNILGTNSLMIKLTYNTVIVFYVGLAGVSLLGNLCRRLS